jgi:hypothetical protein
MLNVPLVGAPSHHHDVASDSHPQSTLLGQARHSGGYLLYHSVCDVQVQSSGDSSEHGRVLTEDRNNLEFEEFFPLRGTSRLSARNLAEGLHGMLPANDVPVDVLPLVPWNLLPVLGSAYISGFFLIEPNPLYVVYT